MRSKLLASLIAHRVTENSGRTWSNRLSFPFATDSWLIFSTPSLICHAYPLFCANKARIISPTVVSFICKLMGFSRAARLTYSMPSGTPSCWPSWSRASTRHRRSTLNDATGFERIVWGGLSWGAVNDRGRFTCNAAILTTHKKHFRALERILTPHRRWLAHQTPDFGSLRHPASSGQQRLSPRAWGLG